MAQINYVLCQVHELRNKKGKTVRILKPVSASFSRNDLISLGDKADYDTVILQK